MSRGIDRHTVLKLPAMTVAGVSTKFAAILALDIAGYSRLMELDEAGTFVRVQEIMNSIVRSSVERTGGRVIKTTGDGAFAEWPDARAAVTCALNIQSQNEARELGTRADRRARFRVGLHADDVISSGDDIFGEGINIAARLEGIAGVGEVYTSEAVAQQAGGACTFLDLGERRLKNIARPVRVFRAADPDDVHAGSGTGPTLDLHVQGFGDRPAIAVLPFREAGADAGHFAEGVTEGIIGALSQWHSFPVISRNSVYALATGGALDLRLVGQQLGVRYVLEGSLRRAEGRLRATVSLIDVDKDATLLSEVHEGAAADLFTLQDQLVRNVVGRLEPALLLTERDRVASARPANPNTYEAVQLGIWHHYRFDQPNNLQAQAILTKALTAEPGNAHALSTLALVLTHAVNAGWQPAKEAALRQALLLARRAVASAPRDPQAHFALGTVYQNTARPTEAERALREAVTLNPSHAAAHANLGLVLCFLDRADEALPELELAQRLSPSDPRLFMWSPARAASHLLAGRHRAALAAAMEALALKPDYPVALRYAASALGMLGRPADAQPMLKVLRRFDVDLAGTTMHLRRFFNENAALRLTEGLRRAGFD